MGACVPYKVRVLRLVEDVVEVSAVHAFEALELARAEPGVFEAVEVVNDEWEYL
jgi:hypothetical protein